MALVWIIDLVVQYVKILVGRQTVPAAVRVVAWLALIGMVIAAITAVVLGLRLLYDQLATIEPPKETP
ncbi:hypothetical protein GCM10027289_29740 [Tsukamurella serpentis]